MASFPLYDTFFYYFTQKSSLFVQLFRKKWEKNWASTKKLFDSPLKGGGGVSPDFCENTILRYELAMMARTCTNNLRVVLSP